MTFLRYSQIISFTTRKRGEYNNKGSVTENTHYGSPLMKYRSVVKTPVPLILVLFI